jgi:hypothetical protein
MKLRLCPTRTVALAVVIAGCTLAAAPAPASALNPVKPICSVGGWFSGIVGKVCTVAQHPSRIISAGKKLAGGHVGGAVKTALGDGGGGGSTASTAIGLAAIGAWVLGGAKFALHETAKVLASTTRPQLQSTWFSSAYWRMAGVAGLLTLPFLFAAAVQAVMRSDLSLLARATLGYLPLALLAVSVAAPLTTLLLAASDEMSAIVSSAAGNAGAHFLDRASLTIGGLTLLSGSPFLAFLVGLLTAAGTLALWMELLMREAAVYVVVLMLPLVFAALVWPARRVWAIRTVELLIALILSKFAIVAVLALGGAAMSQSVGHSVTGFLAGIVLVVLAAFAPWALVRLMPLSELASGAAGSLRPEARALRGSALNAEAGAHWAHDWAGGVTSRMQRQLQETSESAGTRSDAPELSAPPQSISDSAAGPGSGGGVSNDGRADALRADDGATPGMAQAGESDSAGRGAQSPDGRVGRAGAPGGADDEGAHANGPQPDGAHLTGTRDGSAHDGGARGGGPDPGSGWAPVWHAPDETLPPLALDLEHLQGPQVPWGSGDVDEGQPGPHRSAPPRSASAEENTGDNHDPRPPAQDRDGGLL